MDRKYFYSFTVLLFSLFQASIVHADIIDEIDVPWEGGVIRDSIIVSELVTNGFDKMVNKEKNTKALKVQTGVQKATVEFEVVVPKGQMACFRYKIAVGISPKKGVKSTTSHVEFQVQVDKNPAITHQGKQQFSYTADEVVIPAGEHTVYIETTYNHGYQPNTYTQGGILTDMSLHIHKFSEGRLTREPLCGIPGVIYSKCGVCARDSTLYIQPAHEAHSLVVRDRNKTSCMSMSDTLKVCENCPYVYIAHSGEMFDHDFDDNDSCMVCGLHVPRHNADSTVFYVYNAGEMRILSEMVSIGRVPGNIGVDIRSDLTFDADITMLPLGTFDHPFQGVLNGNGHRIRGITNSYQGVDCLGFVGVAKGTLLSHAVIANLIFDDENILAGTSCVGGIVGYATECDIINCANFAALEGNSNVGGIVGYADKQVSLINCASVSTIRTRGTWNTMACGMPNGHILNSYGSANNSRGGTFDEMPTTSLRHCFSSQGSGEGLTLINQNMLSSYAMVELLNEQSENPCFQMSETDHYPVPVSNTTVQAKPNKAIKTPKTAYAWREAWSASRAAARASKAEDYSKPKQDVETVTGYVDVNSPTKFHKTIEEIISEDDVKYDSFLRAYISEYSIPEGFSVGDRIVGGKLKDFESYMLPADSSYIVYREYQLVSDDKFKAQAESYYYLADGEERIDEYDVSNGEYSLLSRLTFLSDFDLVYEENIDGIMTRTWSVETEYDDEGNAVGSSVYSYNITTGEVNLEDYFQYNGNGHADYTEDDGYVEYLDSLTNTIHVLYNYFNDDQTAITEREHYILRADDQTLLEIRSEVFVNGEPVVSDGLYFLYYDDGKLDQAVLYGSADKDKPGEDLRLHAYYEYAGYWEENTFPTSIQVPSLERPTIKERADHNVYDLRGRVLRRVTDAKDPFSGLPHGVYIYHGKKYIVRN